MTQSYPVRETNSLSMPLRVADLPGKGQVDFVMTPGPAERETLARDLGLERLRKLTFKGRFTPEGRHDWRLDGFLGATVVQACVISGDPVTTRIDTPVSRLFLRRMPQVEADEMEMPEDDTLEPLGSEIDPGVVMAEALALALPDYPRADGASFESYSDNDDDAEDEKPNPFAVLAALKDKTDDGKAE